MSRAEWVRERFGASISQGIGFGIQAASDPTFGGGIYAWDDGAALRVFENGFTYDGSEQYRFRYDELTDLELLDLRALMKAQRAPQEPVEFAVVTAEGRRVLRLPLLVYTTLSSVLDAIVRGDR